MPNAQVRLPSAHRRQRSAGLSGAGESQRLNPDHSLQQIPEFKDTDNIWFSHTSMLETRIKRWSWVISYVPFLENDTWPLSMSKQHPIVSCIVNSFKHTNNIPNETLYKLVGREGTVHPVLMTNTSLPLHNCQTAYCEISFPCLQSQSRTCPCLNRWMHNYCSEWI